MNANVTNTYTDIYVNGGGNWLTESYATNFHHFYKRKMLTGSESIADFREVTDAEKTALEASDAVWVRPPQSFIDQWNKAAGSYGRYNEDTGFFELNGLTDITYEEALIIYKESSGANFLSSYSHAGCKSRTFFPVENSNGSFTLTPSYAFAHCYNLRVLVFSRTAYIATGDGMFNGCTKLEEITGNLNISSSQFTSLSNLPKLREVRFRSWSKSLNIGASPNLSLASVKSAVSVNVTAPATITVHPEVFAKIADEVNEEWHALLTMAAEKDIQFASA